MAFICYQDFRYRAVYWFCFPILAVLLFVMKGISTNFIIGLTDAAYGLGFLFIQLLFLWAYFSIKHKRAVDITRNYLGWGDILFLVTITLYLSPGNYVLFYITSLIAVLLYALLSANKRDKGNNSHIPLAGLQAMLLILVMLADFSLPSITLYDDSWIYLLMV